MYIGFIFDEDFFSSPWITLLDPMLSPMQKRNPIIINMATSAFIYEIIYEILFKDYALIAVRRDTEDISHLLLGCSRANPRHFKGGIQYGRKLLVGDVANDLHMLRELISWGYGVEKTASFRVRMNRTPCLTTESYINLYNKGP